MLGLFGVFGRSQELQRLDKALLGVGLHPRLVPEAVKLTTLKLLGEAGARADPASCAAAAELLGYCVLGAEGFTEHNDSSLAEAVENRLEAALEAGDNLDARLVLLTLHEHDHSDVTAGYSQVNSGFRPEQLRASLVDAGFEVSQCDVTSRERRKPYFEVVSAFATKPDDARAIAS